MLSMSLLMYDQVGHTLEYVMLNNKGFSPCAIIAAYKSPEPAELTTEPIRLSIEAYPDRYMKMREMGYDGNRLLRKLEKRIKKEPEHPKQRITKKPTPPILLRKKIFF